MTYRSTLIVAAAGVVLFFFGRSQGWVAPQVAGFVLVAAMFAVFMTRKLRRG